MLYPTAFLLVAAADGFSTFKGQIPNGDRVRNCDGNIIGGIGHHTQCMHGDCPTKGGGIRNQFGIDFAANSFAWTQDLCEKDSDGDGKTNGLELGDPDCEWMPGQVPKFDAAISHPGENCVSDACREEDGPRAQESPNAPPGCTKYEHPTTHSFPMVFPGTHTVPTGTAYLNLAFDQPLDAPPVMITKFEHVVNDTRVLHHMVLFRCDQSMKHKWSTPVRGSMEGCPIELMIWAIGGQDFCTPEGIGFLIQPGDHFAIQIHYDNPQGHTDINDHSGMIMHGVPHAAAQELTPARTWMIGPGQNYFVIPPRQEAHRITTVFDPLVDARETEDVVIFAYLQHMHLIGKKQWLKAEKPDGTTEEVLCDVNYNFDLQETRYFHPQPYRISPGTKLTLDCVWDSSMREGETPGGQATEEEMCYLFIYFTGYQGLSAGGREIGYVKDEYNTSDVADKYCGCLEGWVPPPPSDSNFGYRVSMLLAHGLVMIAAWGLLLPMGAAFPLTWRKALPERWFEIHRNLQLAGAAAMTVGFALAFMVTERHFDMNVPHKVMGLGIFVLAIAQTIGGIFRPHKSDSGDSPARSTWLMLHRILAALLIIASVLQCVGGAFLFGEFQPDYGSSISTTALLTCFAGCWLIALITVFAGRMRESAWQKQVDIEETEMPAAS